MAEHRAEVGLAHEAELADDLAEPLRAARGESGLEGSRDLLVVELLVTAVIGAQFGFEASSFFVDEGNRPRIGQAFQVQSIPTIFAIVKAWRKS